MDPRWRTLAIRLDDISEIWVLHDICRNPCNSGFDIEYGEDDGLTWTTLLPGDISNISGSQTCTDVAERHRWLFSYTYFNSFSIDSILHSSLSSKCIRIFNSRWSLLFCSPVSGVWMKKQSGTGYPGAFRISGSSRGVLSPWPLRGDNSLKSAYPSSG